MKPRTQARPGERPAKAAQALRPRAKMPGATPRRQTPAPLAKIKDILVPTDFSKYSEVALKYALALARQLGGRITLLYVLEPLGFTDFQNYPLSVDDSTAKRQATEKLSVLREQHDRGKEFIKAINVVVGKPFDQITGIARGMRLDLIVIATHGRTGLKHVLLGSTAEKVVRHATCPVLVVRGNKLQAPQ